jgi:hypothetical protein
LLLQWRLHFPGHALLLCDALPFCFDAVRLQQLGTLQFLDFLLSLDRCKVGMGAVELGDVG